MKPKGLVEEQAADRLDRLLVLKKVMQRGDVRAFGMAALHRLFELLRIAEEHDAPRGLRRRQHVGERHLRGLVDEQNIHRVRRIGRSPEPRRSAGHVTAIAYGR